MIKKFNKFKLNEGGIYDFYEREEGKSLVDKILNYYIDKVRKHGMESITDKEKSIFKDAQKGELTMGQIIYARDKVTGDIEIDNTGSPVVINNPNEVFPGVPFYTSKGKGEQKSTIIEARCYRDIDSSCRHYYVYSDDKITNENPYGLIIYKTESKDNKPFGTFIVPKGDVLKNPKNLWDSLSSKFDKGTNLDEETLNLFLKFDSLYKSSRKNNAEFLAMAYETLKKYPDK